MTTPREVLQAFHARIAALSPEDFSAMQKSASVAVPRPRLAPAALVAEVRAALPPAVSAEFDDANIIEYARECMGGRVEDMIKGVCMLCGDRLAKRIAGQPMKDDPVGVQRVAAGEEPLRGA